MGRTAQGGLRSYEFRRERQSSWSELDRLVTRVEKSGIASLNETEVVRLPVLYRAALFIGTTRWTAAR